MKLRDLDRAVASSSLPSQQANPAAAVGAWLAKTAARPPPFAARLGGAKRTAAAAGLHERDANVMAAPPPPSRRRKAAGAAAGDGDDDDKAAAAAAAEPCAITAAASRGMATPRTGRGASGGARGRGRGRARGRATGAATAAGAATEAYRQPALPHAATAVAEVMPGDALPAQPLSALPPLPRPLPPPPASMAASAPSQQTSASKARTARSQSPVKRLVVTRLRPHPILSCNIYDPAVALPPDLMDMLGVIEDYSQGIGVIDASVKHDIERYSRDNRGFKLIRQTAYATPPVGNMVTPPASTPTRAPSAPPSHVPLRSPSPEAVARIIRLATEAHDDGFAEPHWNCRVHTRVLEMALEHGGIMDKVDFLNCTAQIQPKTLIPPTHAGMQGEAKLVDFALYVKPDARELEAMRAMAARQPPDVTPAVNHTWHDPLLTRPISVSVETKRTGEGWDTAMMQSGVWVAAHLTKLQQMVAATVAVAYVDDYHDDEDHSGAADGASPLPTLPLLVAQGHNWYFLAASRGADGQTNIWGQVDIGSTASPLGVYKIIATLQYLAHWTRHVYAPWFFANALGV